MIEYSQGDDTDVKYNNGSNKDQTGVPQNAPERVWACRHATPPPLEEDQFYTLNWSELKTSGRCGDGG
jgi:hypothetical protein